MEFGSSQSYCAYKISEVSYPLSVINIDNDDYLKEEIEANGYSYSNFL